MAAYTENFGLHQWVPEDDFLRTDFNTDFQKIDAALGEALTDDDLLDIRIELFTKCQLYYGSFAGNGTDSQVINLGVEPRVVVITNSTSMYATMIAGTVPMGPLAIVSNGFEVGTGGNIPQNESGKRYYYFCLR